MFVIPYSTDAPLYHPPVATIGLIAANTAVFALEMLLLQSPAGEEVVKSYCLELGGGVHPVQWVTANFLHAGIMYLLGNMFGLWVFGLIVEGKIGWWRFLSIYLGIGVPVLMINQVISLGFEPNVGLGASGIVYGLMGMALVWAPENNLSCLAIFSIRPYFFEMQVRVVAFLYVGLQVIVLCFTRQPVSAEAVHTLGAVAGFGVAWFMLRKDWVDCENWDVFSVWSGRNNLSEEEREALDRKANQPKPLSEEEAAAERQRRKEMALRQIFTLIDEGKVGLALAANSRLAREIDGWLLPEPAMLKLLVGCFEKVDEVDPVPLAKQYLSHYTQHAVGVRLKMAETLICRQQRPSRGMKVLAELAGTRLNDKQRAVVERLKRLAEAGMDGGTFELAEE
jgi:membrane associated rhomboid family serine protease